MNQHIPFAALEIRGLEQVLRPAGGRRPRPHRPRRRVLRPARPERRRQDHDAAHGRGPAAPDAGSISVFGIDALADPVAAKRIMAWVSDEPMIYDKLTPFEYLEFVAGPLGHRAGDGRAARRRADRLARPGPHAHERCEGFSKGMRQKVALAGALVHDPRLIILDEPLTGLDAGSARQVKNVLRERVAAGGTVIMTTHILEVAERMADRIGVIAGGRLIAEGTLDELRSKAGKGDASLEDTFLDAGRRTGARRREPPPPPLALARAPRVPPRLARLVVDADRRQAAPRPRRRRWRSSAFARVHAFRRVLDRRASSPRSSPTPTAARSWSSPAARCSPGR